MPIESASQSALAANQASSHVQATRDRFLELLPSTAELLDASFSFALLLVLCLVIWLVIDRVILRIVMAIVGRTRTDWDDIIADTGVFRRMARLPPLIVFYIGVTAVDVMREPFDVVFARLTLATIALVVARSIGSALLAINTIYSRYDIALGRPIKGYVQVLQVLTYAGGAIFMVAALLDRSPLVFFTGLGAMTAVLLLVFRDTLLSLVAGIQLTSNGLIRVGDWIEMTAFGADGNVVDIALNTVTVQNWDNTVTVIPTHKFLENSFKNWRQVFEQGARRIKRFVLIDVSSIHFLSESDFDRLLDIRILAPYLQGRKEEIVAYNDRLVEDGIVPDRVNLRAMTNLGTFRAYANAYLRANTKLRQDLSMMVRHLQPTEQGLPLEIYAFSAETSWPVYEGVQADIFDHLISVMPYFGLRVFQTPAGADMQALTSGDRAALPICDDASL